MMKIRLLILPIAIVAILGGSGASAQLHYAGSDKCVTCHRSEAEAWNVSHHALAWTKPSEKTVLGDFTNSTFAHKDLTARFFREGGVYKVETEGDDGKKIVFPVVGVAGVAPLQQYLVDTGRGRIQALDVAWDIAGRRWYHLYPDADLRPGDGLHWTGPYKNWNGRCAVCHATGYQKNYDLESRTYRSAAAEIGVGCEACHGPGSAHLSWALSPDNFTPPAGADAQGFLVRLASEMPEAEIQQCAGCHARREPYLASSPLPGTPFLDAYRLALLRPGLYHVDGTIQDEVYVYGSFLQSKMYDHGVRCTNCHDPHAAKLKAEGNAVCTQCHSPVGNERFPSLAKRTYEDRAHHFHEPGTPGAQCKSCHMIERVYMGIDGRRDHSFRIPRPDLSIITGAPNACTDCHAQRGNEWAAAEIAAKFPDKVRTGSHFSQALASGRAAPAANRDLLFDIAAEMTLPGIIRASALDLLLAVADDTTAARTAELLSDPDPLVRATATSLQRGASPANLVQRLVPLLSDSVRSVRIAAARELLNAPAVHLPERIEQAKARATKEWLDSLSVKADYPEAQLMIGGTALVLRNVPAAIAAFREAVFLDPQRVEAWIMIVRIHAAMGDKAAARAALEEGLAANPDDPRLLLLGSN